MARWDLLTDALVAGERDRLTLSWAQLEQLVGGLPASATKHRAWWSGDRPHVRAWRETGFTVAHLALGREVTFARTGAGPRDSQDRGERPAPFEREGSGAPLTPAVDLLVVTCVKAKQAKPAAARDLYVSELFRRERAYAEQLGVPWFILSAEHGLVAPTEWLAPYERYLPDTPASYRRAWGEWVAERLELLAGSLAGAVIEVHAGAAYLGAVAKPLTRKGATIRDPLAGLSLGERLRWYAQQSTRTVGRAAPDPAADGHEEAAAFVAALLEEERGVAPEAFLGTRGAGTRTPGLYSWWVDADGAAQLSDGLGVRVEPGLIYAGLAGATRWPSGKRSTNTLWTRIADMHLGGRHEFSTFRRTLGSILASTEGSVHIDETRLSEWMSRHLRVVVVPYGDADGLGRLESAVLRELDPPLNLAGMTSTPGRRRLSEVRRQHN